MSSSSSSSSSTSAASTCSCSTETAPPFYLDEKWKLSKKESSRSISSNSSSFVNKNSSTHHKKCTFARKCARLVKEQRARFYIMRRCVVMLICWNDHYSDS